MNHGAWTQTQMPGLWELSGWRPFVVRIKRVIKSSCTSVVVQKNLMLVGSDIQTAIFCTRKVLEEEVHVCCMRSQGLWCGAHRIRVYKYIHGCRTILGSETNWHWMVCISTINSLILQNMIATSELQWSRDHWKRPVPLPELHQLGTLLAGLAQSHPRD